MDKNKDLIDKSNEKDKNVFEQLNSEQIDKKDVESSLSQNSKDNKLSPVESSDKHGFDLKGEIVYIENSNLKAETDIGINYNLENSTIHQKTQEKKEKRRKKIKKFQKNCLKALTVASCFTFLGVGIGAGGFIAQSMIVKYEKDTFSFDNIGSNESIQVSLTSNSIASVFEEVGDSVVNISTITTYGSRFSGTGSGSGIIYKIEDDIIYIITNNHVIENASTITISVTGTEQISAKLIGTDVNSDIAVISVSKQAMYEAGIEQVTVAKFTDSDQVKVGEFVFPIGNALGRGKTITQGIISAQNKQINIDGTELTVLQTDAAINPGNSGGALINSDGEVVGINTAKLSSSAIEGIGYAIPTNIALQVAEDIIENGSVQRPYLGIQGETITDDIKFIFNLKTGGVLITYVESGSNAEKAGLVTTDIITSFNGQKIETIDDLSNAIKSVKLNDVVEVEIIRNGFQEMTIDITFSYLNANSY